MIAWCLSFAAETVSQVTGELNEFPSLSETEEMNEEHSGEPEEMSSTDDQEPSEHDGGTGVLQGDLKK